MTKLSMLAMITCTGYIGRGKCMKAIYIRVSSEEQAKKGYSIEDQIAQCKARAKTDEVMEYIDDGYSGEFLDRPALSKLREDLKEGLISEVICYDPDRLSRKLMNQLIVSEEIEKRGILTFVNHNYQKTPEGMLFYQMRGAIAEFEKAKITERMSAGRRRKALQGKIVKNPNMYGYSYNKEEAQFEIIEKEAKVIRMIFDLFTKPNNLVQGINGIAHYLTEQGIPTKKNVGVWHRQVVRQILMNEAYAGRFFHNRWNTEGMLGNRYKPEDERIPMTLRPRDEWIEVPCPAIVDEDVFNHAQKLLKESRRRWAKRSVNQYLLSGIIRCGHCGNTMTGRRQKNWDRYDLEYSDVKNTAGAKNKGCGNKVKSEKLDADIWEQVRDMLNDPAGIAQASKRNDDEINYEEMELNRITDEIKSTQEGRKRLLKLFADGLDISDDEMRSSLKELKDKEEDLKKRYAEALSKIKENETSEYSKKIYEEVANHLLSMGEKELTFEDKQELIRYVVREVIVYKDKVVIHSF